MFSLISLLIFRQAFEWFIIHEKGTFFDIRISRLNNFINKF